MGLLHSPHDSASDDFDVGVNLPINDRDEFGLSFLVILDQWLSLFLVDFKALFDDFGCVVWALVECGSTFVAYRIHFGLRRMLNVVDSAAFRANSTIG